MAEINNSMGQIPSSPAEFNPSITGSVPDIQSEIVLEGSKETSTNDSVICLDDDDEYVLPELHIKNLAPENKASKDDRASSDDDFCIVYEKVVPPSDVQILLTSETETFLKTLSKRSERRKHKLQTNSDSDRKESSEIFLSENGRQESFLDDSVSIIEDKCTASQSTRTNCSNLRQSLIDSSEKKKRKIECAVCFDGPDEISRTGRNLTSTVCGHIFCDECIQNSVKICKRCPQCRKKLTAKQYHPIYL